MSVSMIKTSSQSVVLKPRVSEKAYGMSGKTDKANVYVFDVDSGNNKHTIARAIESQYGVSVTAVNVTNAKGKAKRTMRKGGRPVNGRTSDVKKAYVTLKLGDSIPIFAAIEEASAKEDKANEQFAKSMEKAAEKAASKEEKSAAKAAKKENK